MNNLRKVLAVGLPISNLRMFRMSLSILISCTWTTQTQMSIVAKMDQFQLQDLTEMKQSKEEKNTHLLLHVGVVGDVAEVLHIWGADLLVLSVSTKRI
jgi:EamA domain-containing membrane protein RarD